MLLAFARGDEADRAFWRRCIERGDVSDADVRGAVERVRATGALDDTRLRAERFADAALADLRTAPACEMRDILEDVVAFTTVRAH